MASAAADILDRPNEVSFNSVLNKELPMVAFLRRVAEPGNTRRARWAGLRIHRGASEMLTDLGAFSTLNADGAFLVLPPEEGCRSTLTIDDLLRRI